MSDLSRPVARKLTKKDLIALFIRRRILGERYPRCGECHKRVDPSDIASLRMIHKDGTPMCHTAAVLRGGPTQTGAMSTVIFDFVKGRVLYPSDKEYEAERERLRLMMARQTMSATGGIPPEGWRP